MTILQWALATVFVLGGCAGQSSFNGGSGKRKDTKPESADAGPEKNSGEGSDTDGEDTGKTEGGKKVYRATQTFNVGNAARPIDMVWIVDNSGSMGGKIRQVEANLNRFVESVRGQADLQIAMITEFCGAGGSGSGGVVSDGADWQLCVNVTDPGVNLTRIHVNVGSYNSLAILAAAQVRQGSVQVSGQNSVGPYMDAQSITINGVTFDPLRNEIMAGFGGAAGGVPAFIEAPDQITQAEGALLDFFRPDAARVFVVVSDEDDYALGAAGYQRFAETLPESDRSYRMYGFVQVQNNGPGGTTVSGGLSPWPSSGGNGQCFGIASKAYPALATASGGNVYDICEPDWSKTFGDLTRDVLKAVQAEYQLDEQQVTEVLSVTVNGKKLASSAYRLEGNRVLIDADALKGEDADIAIEYEYTGD